MLRLMLNRNFRFEPPARAQYTSFALYARSLPPQRRSRSLGEIAGFRRHSCAVGRRPTGKVAHSTHMDGNRVNRGFRRFRVCSR